MSNVILALPAECWRWIPGYEGLYQVSTRGRVRSVDRWITYANGRKHFVEGRILKPGQDGWGYLHVDLCRNGKKHRFKVHRLVAMAWLDNPENKPQINHRDEDKTNCDVFNLSYCTAKENVNWGTRTERTCKPVQAINPKTGEVVLEFPSAREAQRNGFDSGAISSCCNGKMLSHKGFVWKYKDDYDQESAWTPVKIGIESRAASRSKAVEAVDPKTGQVVREFPSTAEAGRNGFHSGTISACCRGVSYKTHKGYIWRFKE